MKAERNFVRLFIFSEFSYFGHGCFDGELTGKIIDFAAHSVVCAKCEQKIVLPHVCYRNHLGSANSMEADMIVELILKDNNSVDAKCRVRRLIADDDSSVIAALRLLSYSIEKWADFNHSHGSCTSKLFELKVTFVVREYLSKNITI